MSRYRNQPNYTGAKKQAIADIKQELLKEGKSFFAYNSKITVNINIIIGSEGKIEPTPITDIL